MDHQEHSGIDRSSDHEDQSPEPTSEEESENAESGQNSFNESASSNESVSSNESNQDSDDDQRFDEGSLFSDGDEESIVCEPWDWQECPCEKVHSLSSIILNSVLIDAMFVLNYTDQCEEDEETKEKKYQCIVDYYKPFREFLASVPMVFEMYEPLEPFALSRMRGYCSYIFWLCFKNIEAKKVRIDSFYHHEDKGRTYINQRLNFIIKSKEPLKFCTFLRLQNKKRYGSRIEAMDLLNLFNNGENFPFLQELHIELELRQDYEKMFGVILPKLKTVSMLKVCFTSYPNFLSFTQNIEKSQQLTYMEMNCYELYKINESAENRTVNLKILVAALKKLKNLKHFEIFNWCPKNYEETEDVFKDLEPTEELTKVDNVNSICLNGIALTDIMLIGQHFENVQKLGLNMHDTQQDYTTFTMQSLTTITCLKINNVNTDEAIFFYFDVFPNLIELEIDLAVEGDRVYKEAKFLKKFVILQNKIRNPKLLLKMPKLEHFSMKWSKDNKLKEAKALKPYLPLHCKIYERLKNDDFVEINV